MPARFQGRVVLGLALASVLSAPSAADPLTCPDQRFQTEAAGADATLICEIAARAAEQLSTCNLNVPEPVLIEVVDALETGCLGVYHCGERRIEIERPAAYAAHLAGGSGAFAPVSEQAFFESIIRHELVHAALDEMPCPFDSCVVGQEYVAYTMQVRFLPDADRAAFAAVDPVDGQVSRDILNPMILMMAPDLFARRAWQHLTQRDDACAFIGQIARAEVLLDYEHR